MSATIDPLRQQGAHSWGSKAAAGDALNRAPNDAPFIALWIVKDTDGREVIKWSKANSDFTSLSFMAIAVMEFAQSCVRVAMDKDNVPPAA